MKKSFLLKIAVCVTVLALILVSAVPAFAARTVTVKVEIAGSDNLLYVRLTAPASSDISTFSAALKYDETKLEFNSVSFLDDPSIVNSKNADTAGIAVASTVIAESLTEKTKIFTYVFTVLDGAEGTCEFSFDNVQATDSNNNSIDITFDGNLSAVISELEPLTPDVIQSTFETTTLPESDEPESVTEPEKENADDPNVPYTTRNTIAAISVCVLGVAAVASVIALKKKKDEE